MYKKQVSVENGDNADKEFIELVKIATKREFSPANKKKLIISLLKGSVIMQFYDVAFEVLHVFMQELLTFSYTPLYDIFIK